jgi:hypothetical protein
MRKTSKSGEKSKLHIVDVLRGTLLPQTMSVTKIRNVPTQLSHVHLYLDDIEEICTILTEAASPPNKINFSPQISFQVGDDLRIDTIEELREHGGTASRFTIDFQMGLSAHISLNGMRFPTIYLYGVQDAEKWAVYSRVKAVFDARRLVLKGAIPDWLEAVFSTFLLVSMAPVVIYFKRHSADLVPYVLAAYGIALCLAIVLAFSANRVSFARSHERAKEAIENRTSLVKTISLMLLSFFLGAVINHFASLWK